MGFFDNGIGFSLDCDANHWCIGFQHFAGERGTKKSAAIRGIQCGLAICEILAIHGAKLLLFLRMFVFFFVAVA